MKQHPTLHNFRPFILHSSWMSQAAFKAAAIRTRVSKVLAVFSVESGRHCPTRPNYGALHHPPLTSPRIPPNDSPDRALSNDATGYAGDAVDVVAGRPEMSVQTSKTSSDYRRSSNGITDHYTIQYEKAIESGKSVESIGQKASWRCSK